VGSAKRVQFIDPGDDFRKPWRPFYRLDSVEPCDRYVYVEDIVAVAEGRCPSCRVAMTDFTAEMDTIWGTVFKCDECCHFYMLDGGQVIESHPTDWCDDPRRGYVPSGRTVTGGLEYVGA
jgi:hypothetical protein